MEKRHALALLVSKMRADLVPGDDAKNMEIAAMSMTAPNVPTKKKTES